MAAILSIFDNGVIGEEKSTGAGLGNEAVAGRGVRSGEYLTFTLADLRELGCYAASTGEGLAPYKAHLLALAEARRKVILEECESKNAEPSDRLSRIREERDALFAEVDPAAKHTSEGALRCELAKQNALMSGLLLQARADRAENAWQERRRYARERGEFEQERLNEQITRAQTILPIIEQDFVANEAERGRQAERLENRSRIFDQQLQETRARIADLNESGITRPVAGFLVWGSSASLIGAGIAVGRLLQRALLAAAGKQSEDSLLLSWLSKVHSPRELIALFASFMALVIAAVVVIAAFTLLIRFLLRRYDPAWQEPEQRQESSDDDGWSEWLDMFSVVRRIGRGVSDHSLQQIVGVLPLVIAAAAIAFLFVAFGDRSSGNVSFVASQLGPAFVMLSVVSFTLFITNVLSAARAKKTVSWWGAGLFGLISLLPLLSLLLSGFASTNTEGFGARAPITAIAVAMTLASSSLAFGLVYRGHFAHEDFLEREIERIEANIIYLRVKPTLATLLSSGGGKSAAAGQQEPEPSGRGFARAVRQMGRWFLVLRFWEPNRSSSGNEAVNIEQAVREVELAGDRLAEMNAFRVTRDRLQSALEQLERWEKVAKEARELIESTSARCRNELRDLALEEERALLEIENAFYIASASLAGPRAAGAV